MGAGGAGRNGRNPAEWVTASHREELTGTFGFVWLRLAVLCFMIVVEDVGSTDRV